MPQRVETPWLKIAAIGTWLVGGVPAAAAILRGDPATGSVAWWAVAFVSYGVALIAALRVRGRSPHVARLLLLLQSVSAMVATYVAAAHLHGSELGLLVGIALLVVVAAQLPHVVAVATAYRWIAANTTAMALALIHIVGVDDLLTFALGAAAFQMFATTTTSLMLREADARAELARTNAELLATRTLLAENSRAGERLRIARDLHDTLGHHLTALCLQLDVASRVSEGKATEHVHQGHALARLLLAEVRSVVGEMRQAPQDTDVVGAIRMMAAGTTAVNIHLDLPDRLALESGAQAHSLVRCVQEIITNTARHSHARNLWISVHASANGITLNAHDDGRGTDSVACGNGLKGMRERFEEYSGRIEFHAKTGEGFTIHGFMPTAQVPS